MGTRYLIQGQIAGLIISVRIGKLIGLHLPVDYQPQGPRDGPFVNVIIFSWVLSTIVEAQLRYRAYQIGLRYFLRTYIRHLKIVDRIN